MSEANKAVVRRLLEGFNSGDPGVIDEVYAPNLVYHGTGQMANADKETYKQFIGMVLQAFQIAEW